MAVALATSLADWTKCRLAAGLFVLEEAILQELHKVLVYLAIVVAEERICCCPLEGWQSVWHACFMAYLKQFGSGKYAFKR